MTRLLNRHFVMLWQAQFVSLAGSQGFFVAMMYWTKEATGSSSIMGLLMTLSILPGVILGPAAGAFADRHSRRTILLICDFIAASLAAALALLFFKGADRALMLPALFAATLMMATLGSFFRPAFGAAMPDLVPREKLMTATSLNSFSFQASAVTGLGLGGVIYAWLGPALLFLIDSLSYLYSALCVLTIRIPRHQPAAAADRGLAQFAREVAEGFRFVWSRRGMREFLFMVGLVNFLMMPAIVLLPFLVEINLGGGVRLYGFLLAAHSAGALAGITIAALPVVARVRKSRLLIPVLSGVAVSFAVLGWLHDRGQALALMAAAGVLGGIFNVMVMTIFQLSTPTEMRGRVMGLVMTIAMGAAPLGMAAGGLAGDLTGKNVPLIYGVSGGLTALVVFTLGLRDTLRGFLDQNPDPSDAHVAAG